KKEAAIALLKNKQPVAPQQLDKIAANKDYRRDLYDEMIKLKAGTLFPRKYMTQASLSESDMSLYASDDETPGLTLLGSRTASFEGKMQKFYLYRIRFAGGDEDEDVGAPATEYLGVAGPYAIDALNLKTTNDASGIYYKENFDPKKMDSQFKEYLKGVTADKTDANEYN
ncbi:MAG TPA: hypothetical protein VK644_11295, partial [Chitinophagaceae bacterium]|nr:hypothetical protein [Chitinophagaceae bacterium]